MGTTVTAELNVIQISLHINTLGILETIMKMYAHLNTKELSSDHFQVVMKLSTEILTIKNGQISAFLWKI